MVDLSLVAAAAQSIGVIKTLAEGLVSARDANTLMETKSQLMGTVITLQSTLLQMQDEKQQLLTARHDAEDELRRLQRLIDERASVNLQEITEGVYVYAAPVSAGAPPSAPFFCQACYDSGSKSVLQYSQANEYVSPEYKCVFNKAHGFTVGRAPRLP